MERIEYQKLVQAILRHDYLYYVECRPEISDLEYDHLVKRLEAIERAHPEWITSNSPTQRVGEMAHGFQQGFHSVPMLSIANTYSKREVEQFVARLCKLLEREQLDFLCEPKMDGTAVSLLYEKGKFVRGLTRGDGKKGDEITENLKTVVRLPLEIVGKNIPNRLEIRAEVFISYPAFDRLNRAAAERGEEQWANPRNAAAGSLKLMDPKEVSKRALDIICFGIVGEGAVGIPTQNEVHLWLERHGFPIFAEQHRLLCADGDAIMKFAEQVQQERRKLLFPIDGIVAKVNLLRYHDQLGATGKSPRWVIAYKFAAEQATTKVRDIIVQLGRTGVLTPVAELDPVYLFGSTIARATLHNREEVHRKDVRIGDMVIIEKGGDVIPKIVAVDMEKRPPHSHMWRMPTECPSCGHPLVEGEGVALFCPQGWDCPEQKIRRLIFFASKEAMDIAHLGEKAVMLLVEKGLVDAYADFYTLTEEQLKGLDGFKQKSRENLLRGIEASKQVPLDRLIFAFGIHHVGRQTAEILAKHMGDLSALAQATFEELSAIPGVGEIVARSIISYFGNTRAKRDINALLSVGVAPIINKNRVRHGHCFDKKIFVLTGTLEQYTRQAATALIEECGGRVTSSVSRKTDYLLAGADPGAKLEQAKQMGIEVLSESQFEKLLNSI
jgi:DNA ligase (NAD+)